jgi:DNA-binding XRE family transcriptional regulator
VLVDGKPLAKYWGERLAEKRADRGYSQGQLARLIQVTQQTISGIENGKQIPTDWLKIELARYLATTPAELFEWPPMRDLTVTVLDEVAA